MNNANTEMLKKFYAAFAEGDVSGMLSVCSDDVTFQIQGKSKLAGKYTKATLNQLVQKIRELSGGTLKMDIHDIMASDIHGLVLTTNKLSKGGAAQEYRAVQVWRIQGGKLVAWYEYPRDLYQYDAIWS